MQSGREMTVAARMGAGQGGEGLVAGMHFDGGATRVHREEHSQGRAVRGMRAGRPRAPSEMRAIRLESESCRY